ncbi:hypothetical protein C8R47DRAFT_48073 [Mycena vitilis]|nr:hypothetical protein C8R47DRAFT_48073 [Mycena vitilis]
MWFSAVLFNPKARVYNVRLLLALAIATIGWTSYQMAHYPDLVPISGWPLSLVAACLIFLHHTSVLFAGQMRGAMFDMLVTVVEIVIVVACRRIRGSDISWGARGATNHDISQGPINDMH